MIRFACLHRISYTKLHSDKGFDASVCYLCKSNRFYSKNCLKRIHATFAARLREELGQNACVPLTAMYLKIPPTSISAAYNTGMEYLLYSETQNMALHVSC